MKILKILACIAAGWLLNIWVHSLVDKPEPANPLKVTIIDDGGADLKVK